jgi:hypothetical protein
MTGWQQALLVLGLVVATVTATGLAFHLRVRRELASPGHALPGDGPDAAVRARHAEPGRREKRARPRPGGRPDLGGEAAALPKGVPGAAPVPAPSARSGVLPAVAMPGRAVERPDPAGALPAVAMPEPGRAPDEPDRAGAARATVVPEPLPAPGTAGRVGAYRPDEIPQPGRGQGAAGRGGGGGAAPGGDVIEFLSKVRGDRVRAAAGLGEAGVRGAIVEVDVEGTGSGFRVRVGRQEPLPRAGGVDGVAARIRTVAAQDAANRPAGDWVAVDPGGWEAPGSGWAGGAGPVHDILVGEAVRAAGRGGGLGGDDAELVAGFVGRLVVLPGDGEARTAVRTIRIVALLLAPASGRTVVALACFRCLLPPGPADRLDRHLTELVRAEPVTPGRPAAAEAVTGPAQRSDGGVPVERAWLEPKRTSGPDPELRAAGLIRPYVAGLPAQRDTPGPDARAARLVGPLESPGRLEPEP